MPNVTQRINYEHEARVIALRKQMQIHGYDPSDYISRATLYSQLHIPFWKRILLHLCPTLRSW